MQLDYLTFRMANQAINKDTNDVQQLFVVGDLTLYCKMHFDTDEASDTYNHWICSLDVVSDTEDIPERSLVLYPNTLHFDGDNLYVVSITSDLDYIGHDGLQNAFITIGVPTDEYITG